jgi:hypothetical protein
MKIIWKLPVVYQLTIYNCFHSSIFIWLNWFYTNVTLRDYLNLIDCPVFILNYINIVLRSNLRLSAKQIYNYCSIITLYIYYAEFTGV